MRTTNPIASTFATVRARTDTARGCLSRVTMLAMVFKLYQSAAKRWHRLRAAHYLTEVMNGIGFNAGRAAAPTPPAAAAAGAAESTLTRRVSSRGHQLGGITKSATDTQRRDGADRAGAAADCLDTAADHPLVPGHRARRDVSAALGKESGTALL